MQFIIPISFESPFFPEDEYYFPKSLIDINGRPMIDHVVSSLRNNFPDSKFFFIVPQCQIDQFSLDTTLKFLVDDCEIISKNHETKGALCSSMLAIDKLDLTEGLVIANSDQIINYNLNKILEKFVETKSSAGVITFNSIHPRWSYVTIDKKNNVLQAFEKKVKSRSAIAGFYYFKNAEIFFNASQKTILNDASINGNFFISSSLNEVILQGGEILSIEIPESTYHSFYMPSKIENYLSIIQ